VTDNPPSATGGERELAQRHGARKALSATPRVPKLMGHLVGLSSWRPCQLADAPGFEGLACSRVSRGDQHAGAGMANMLHANCRHAQASINACELKKKDRPGFPITRILGP